VRKRSIGALSLGAGSSRRSWRCRRYCFPPKQKLDNGFVQQVEHVLTWMG